MADIENNTPVNDGESILEQDLDIGTGEYEVVEDDERTAEEIDLEMGVTDDTQTNDIPTNEDEEAPEKDKGKPKKKPGKKTVRGYDDNVRRQVEQNRQIEAGQQIEHQQAELNRQAQEQVRAEAEAANIRIQQEMEQAQAYSQPVTPHETPTAYDNAPETTTAYDRAVENSFVHTTERVPVGQDTYDEIPGEQTITSEQQSISKPSQGSLDNAVTGGQRDEGGHVPVHQADNISGAFGPYEDSKGSVSAASYPEIKGSVMPEGYYEGAQILPTPKNDRFNSYNEVKQSSGAYKAPETKESAYDSVVEANKIHTSTGNVPGKENIIADERGNVIQGVSDASIDTKAVNPSQNPASNTYFNISPTDKHMPIQSEQGTPVYGSGGIREAKTPAEAMGAVDKPATSSYQKQAEGATSISGAHVDGIKNAKDSFGDTSAPTGSTSTFDEKIEGRKLETGAARTFKTGADLAASFEGAGKTAIDSVKGMLKDTADDNEDTRRNRNTISNVTEMGHSLGNLAKTTGLTGVLGYTVGVDILNKKADLTELATKAFQDSKLDMSTLSAKPSADMDSKQVKEFWDDMKKKMSDAGISDRDIKTILSDREAIRDNLATQDELRKFYDSKESKGLKGAEKDKLDASRRHTESSDFFNNKFADKNLKEMSSYFKTCDDPLLRQMDPTKMRLKDLKKFDKNIKSGKIKVSAKHAAMVRKTLRDKSALCKRPPKAAKGSFMKGMFGKGGILSPAAMMRYVSKMGDTAEAMAAGRIMTVVRAGRMAITIISFSMIAKKRALDFISGGRYSAMKQKAAMKVRQGISEFKSSRAADIKTAGNKVKEAASKSRSGKALGEAKRKAIGEIRKNPIVQKGQKGISAVKEGINTANNGIKTASVRASETKRAAKAKMRKLWNSKAMAPVRNAVSVVTAPFKAVNSLIEGIRKAVGVVIKYVAIALAVVLGVWLLTVFAVWGILLLGQVINSLAEDATRVVLVEAERMEEWVERYNKLTEQKYDDAMKIAEGYPKNSNVYYGKNIYHYGSPQGTDYEEYVKARMYHNNVPGSKTENGYHIYYIDSQGNTLGQNTTNTKDVICLTTVMLQNNFSLLPGQLPSVPVLNKYTSAKSLMDKWFKVLNPSIKWVESDIYHTENSTDRFLPGTYTDEGSVYYCNDEQFYIDYRNAKAQGVEFYEEPAHDYSHDIHHHGCEFDQERYDNDMDRWRDEEPEPPDWDDFWPYEDPDPDDYDDADSYNEVISDYNDAVAEYNDALGNYENEYDAWREREPNQDDYWYCPGHYSTIDAPGGVYPPGKTPGLKCSYGYKDINLYVTVLTKDDVYRAASDGSNIIKYKVPKDYECTEWEEKQVSIKFTAFSLNLWQLFTGDFDKTGGWAAEENQQWCDELFDQDWYDIYGVDVYDGVSLDAGGGSLSAEEIAELTEGWDDVSEGRAAFVQFALNQVGKIPYYFGGHARVQGYEGNGFGEKITPDEYNESKGRYKRGLDCSGFVSWVYWTVFGVKPGQTTATFTNSLGLQKISFSDLQPGDIGLENVPGSKSNHIGIFVKFDEKTGRAVWVHENSSNVNVGVNQTNCFRLYYRLNR